MTKKNSTFDPRLFRYTRGTRRFLALSVCVGALTAGLVIAQSWLLAATVSSAFVEHRGLAAIGVTMGLLLGVVVARAALGWGTEWAAVRASASAKSDLRTALCDRVVALGPGGLSREPAGRLAVLATHGVDALDEYFARYLPQLVLAVIVPISVIVVVLEADWLSAVIIILTVPLIPLFMALVGISTRQRTQRRLRTLQQLAGHFLDVVAGLPTLKVFGRAKAQARVIEEVSDRYRAETMGTLRISFLSSLILELLATISVALVAVAVGLRLSGGHLNFQTALFVLILAPEAYLPLRLLGARYHASADGVTAACQVFEVLERALPAPATRCEIPDPSRNPLTVGRLAVTFEGRDAPVFEDLSFHVEPGEVALVTGPSGSGKSTLLGTLLGFVEPSSGSIRIGGSDLRNLDPTSWRHQLAWVPQRPHIFARSVEDNVRLARSSASEEEVRKALVDAGLEGVVARLPLGMHTQLGEQGAGLSVGERQRLALARAFLRDAPILLLDEPTANLDGSTEAGIVQTLRRLSRGRTVVIATHRQALSLLADKVIRLEPALVAA